MRLPEQAMRLVSSEDGRMVEKWCTPEEMDAMWGTPPGFISARESLRFELMGTVEGVSWVAADDDGSLFVELHSQSEGDAIPETFQGFPVRCVILEK